MKIILSAACALLLFYIQRSVYKRIWKKNLGVTVSFVTPFAVEGENSALVEVIENKKAFPVQVLRVKFSFARGLLLAGGENVTRSDKVYKNDIFSVMPYMRITRTHEFLCEKRGFYTVDSVSLTSSDLLMSAKFTDVRPNGSGNAGPAGTQSNRAQNAETAGMLSSRTQNAVTAGAPSGGTQSAAFTVYPARADVTRLLPVFSKIMGQREAKAQQPDPFAFRGIRDYAPFDPMRDINWKATAKTGDLKVNVHASTRAGEVRLALDLEPDSDWADNGLREEEIRIAATLASLFVQKGAEVSLTLNVRDIVTQATASLKSGCGPGHLTAIKEALARVDLEKRCAPFEEAVLKVLLENGGEKQETVLITGARGAAKAALYAQLARAGGLHIIFAVRPDAGPLPEIHEANITRWEVHY